MSNVTMRMPDADLAALRELSTLTGRPMAELVRHAIVQMVDDFKLTGRLVEQAPVARARVVSGPTTVSRQMRRA